jgi:hypothetical protein
LVSDGQLKESNMSEQEFSWGDLGEAWWRSNGEACRATEQQIRFACARHQNCNKSKAAAPAGYSGDSDALRSAGVRADGTTAVKDLLVLAAAAEGGGEESTATAAEIDRKLTKLIRSPDGGISLKAIEAHAKREDQRRQRGEMPENDGFSEWRMARDFITLPSNGATAFVLLVDGVGNLPLLHDLHVKLMQEPFGPELWQRFYARLNESGRARLDKHLADPGYQLDARKQIWGEIGMQPPAGINANAIDTIKRDDPIPPSSGSNGSGEINAAV